MTSLKLRGNQSKSDSGAALALVLFFVILTSLWLMAVISLTQSSSSAIAQNVELSNLRSEMVSKGLSDALAKLTPCPTTPNPDDPNELDPENPEKSCTRLGTSINTCSSADFAPIFPNTPEEVTVHCDEGSQSGFEYDPNALYLMGPFLSQSGWNLNSNCISADECKIGEDGGLRVITSGLGYTTEPVCNTSSSNERFLISGGIVDLFGRWDQVDCSNFEIRKPSDLNSSQPLRITYPFPSSVFCPKQLGVVIEPNADCNFGSAMKWGGKTSGVGKVTNLTQEALDKIYEIERASVVTSVELPMTLIAPSAEISEYSSESQVGKLTILSPARNLHVGIELLIANQDNSLSKIRINSGAVAKTYSFSFISGSPIANGMSGQVFTRRATFDPEFPDCKVSGGYRKDFTTDRAYISVFPGEMTSTELSILNPLLDSGSGCGDGAENKAAVLLRSGVYRLLGTLSKTRSSSNSIILNNQEVVLFGGDPSKQFPNLRPVLNNSQENQCPNTGDNYQGVRLEFSGYSYIWVKQGHLVLCSDLKKVAGQSKLESQPVLVAPRIQSYESYSGQLVWGGGNVSTDCSSSHLGDCPLIELEQGSTSSVGSEVEYCGVVKNCIYIKGRIIAPAAWLDLDLNGKTIASFGGGIMARALSVNTTSSGPPGRIVESGRWRYMSNRVVQLWFTEKASGRNLGTLQIEIIDTKSRLAAGYRILGWRAGW
jgi:hypothetical protein